MKKYRLIVCDTTHKLTIDKIYKIRDFGNHLSIVSDVCDDIELYIVTKWQLDNMFEEV